MVAVVVGLVIQRTASLCLCSPHLSVEPPGPAQGGVHAVRPVGGADDEEAIRLVHPVHQGEELGHHAVLRRRLARPPGTQGVHLVQEQHARTLLGLGPRPRKHGPQRLLALAGPRPHHLQAGGVTKLQVWLCRISYCAPTNKPKQQITTEHKKKEKNYSF